MDDLKTLPNLGKDTIGKLKEVGIMSIADLKEVGSEQAFLRLQALDPGACLSLLCALEGAVVGIRWHNLSPLRKEELKQFLQATRKR
jgi:DNA transformation protein and related proteins